MARMDEKLNKYIDGLVLFAGNEKGEVNTDTMVDMAAEMFKEMEPHRYEFEMMNIVIGKGTVVFQFPKNVMFDLIFGSEGKVTLTVDDILEMKELFNS